jgi:predicted ATPase with chaperone activity
MTSDRRFALSPSALGRLEALSQRASGGRVQRAIVRVARTIADLDARDTVEPDDIIQAYEICRAMPAGAPDA